MLMKKSRVWMTVIGIFTIATIIGLSGRPARAQGVSDTSIEQGVQDVEQAEADTESQESQPWALALAISIAIGIPCLGAGYAVAKIGSAALGAASEKPELLAQSLLFVALAEGIAIYGLLIAVLLWLKI